MSSQELVNKVRELKGFGMQRSSFTIPIRTTEGEQIGCLRPVDVAQSEQPEVVERLTRWRRMFMHYFLTQFKASRERTISWLEEVVLPSDDRILFLIYTSDGKPIGNIGVCCLNPLEAELDNVLRGESCGRRQFMYFTTIALLSWLFLELGLETVRLHVFSNNKRAINLYTSTGFQVRQRYRLSRIQHDAELRYLVESSIGDPVSFQYLKMTIDKMCFGKTHSWTTNIYCYQGFDKKSEYLK